MSSVPNQELEQSEIQPPLFLTSFEFQVVVAQGIRALSCVGVGIGVVLVLFSVELSLDTEWWITATATSVTFLLLSTISVTLVDILRLLQQKIQVLNQNVDEISTSISEIADRVQDAVASPGP